MKLLPQVNTLQAVLATDGSITFVMFLYHDIQWSSGTTTIGFNAGDEVNYFTVPESLTADGVLNLDSTSNVGIPGMYIYRVDQDPCTYNITLPIQKKNNLVALIEAAL